MVGNIDRSAGADLPPFQTADDATDFIDKIVDSGCQGGTARRERNGDAAGDELVFDSALGSADTFKRSAAGPEQGGCVKDGDRTVSLVGNGHGFGGGDIEGFGFAVITDFDLPVAGNGHFRGIFDRRGGGRGVPVEHFDRKRGGSAPLVKRGRAGNGDGILVVSRIEGRVDYAEVRVVGNGKRIAVGIAAAADRDNVARFERMLGAADV